jgi:hypothetical protein
MRPVLFILGLLLVGVLVSATLAASPQAAASPDQNTWRYVWHSGEWWYWLPQEKWVYWRNNQWNDYDPAFATNAGQGVNRSYGGSSATGAANSDIRPFYGHADSQWGFGDAGARNSRIRPFYGHALPQEGIYEGTAPGEDIGPFYGKALRFSGR